MSRYGIYDDKLGFLPEDDAPQNVTDINENKPHCVAELICVRCGKRWIGVYPEKTWLKDLECENCGPGFVIKTGQDLEET